MPISSIQTLEVIEVMENFLSRKRPPEEIRSKLDIGYKIEDQSIIVFTVRPAFGNPNKYHESAVAKTTFVKAKHIWKVFWLRADLKWYAYDPKPTVKNVSEFIKLVEEDVHHCFWG